MFKFQDILNDRITQLKNCNNFKNNRMSCCTFVTWHEIRLLQNLLHFLTMRSFSNVICSLQFLFYLRHNLPIVLIILNNNGIGTGVDSETFQNVDDPATE